MEKNKSCRRDDRCWWVSTATFSLAWLLCALQTILLASCGSLPVLRASVFLILALIACTSPSMGLEWPPVGLALVFLGLVVLFLVAALRLSTGCGEKLAKVIVSHRLGRCSIPHPAALSTHDILHNTLSHINLTLRIKEDQGKMGCF